MTGWTGVRRRAWGLGAAGMVVGAASVVAVADAEPAEAAGIDLWFYNGDTCEAQQLAGCLSQSGGVTNGTLFTNDGIRWRGGSGAPSSGDPWGPCDIDKGPIPRGNHPIEWHDDHYKGSLIQGRVWFLDRMDCKWGKPASPDRTEMFIHTEELASQGQECTDKPDDPYCWEGAGDYASAGCVKLSPKDIAHLDTLWHGGHDGNPHLVVDA